MKYFFLVLCVCCAIAMAHGQSLPDTLVGEVTFVTSQSVYVKFPETTGINPGDTLYRKENGQEVPALVVKNTSSTSCVATPLDGQVFEKGMTITSRPEKISPMATETPVTVITPETPALVDPSPDNDVIEPDAKKQANHTGTNKELIKGRIMAASYMTFSDREDTDQQRMRYTMTLNARNLGNSPLSFESYISFRHTIDEWQEVKDNFMRAFKIYSFNLQYAMPVGTTITVGRRINHHMANIGALDGLQLDHTWRRFSAGLFGGSRPDHTDYNINAKLPQFGAYVGHRMEIKNGMVQSTLAFAEQRNHGNTDRRFIYVQHSNAAVKRINIFTSFEFDLYTVRDSAPLSTFDVTSMYFSVRYRLSDKLSLFGSYDARKNIIYYETYKNFIDQLLEDETRQGLRFSFTYRPIRKVTLGSSAGYRFQKDEPRPSVNLNNYITISQIPGIRTSATLSAIWLQSPYLDGIIYGIRTGRDFLKGKLYGEIEYRMVSYRYTHIETPLDHRIAALQLTYRLSKKLSLSCQYEGEFHPAQKNHRVYTNIIQRF